MSEAHLISLVYAVSQNGVIGKDGGLPWQIPSDLKHFKEITTGKAIIMGRKTWECLPRKPLPGRHNIVLSRRASFAASGVDVVDSADAALVVAHRSKAVEICVIGGADVFKIFLPLTQRIHLTRVLADVAGDTFMPQISPEDWKEVARGGIVQEARDSHPFETMTFERRPK